MSRPSRFGWRLCVLTVLIAFASQTTRADVIFLKDGTILQGKLIREAKDEIDPYTHEPYHLPTGFYLIDDGPRRMYFAQAQVAKVVKQEEGESEVRFRSPRSITTQARGVPPVHLVAELEPWDAKWDRKIHFRSEGNRLAAKQHLSTLTPLYAKVDTITGYSWAMYYLTRELGPEMVQALLATNPTAADDPKLKEAERVIRRFRICDFDTQAGWFDVAERNLTKLTTDFPDQKAQVEAARDAMHKARARERFELIKRLHLAGQYKTVKAALDGFPEKEAAEVTAADFRAFKAAFDEAAEGYAQTLRMLDAVGSDLKDAPEGMAAALAEVRSEQHPDRVSRLEAFVGQALQAERQRKAGRTPETSPAALASLAITGWLLGNPSADPKPETALRLWRSRALVLNYIRSDDAGLREKMMNSYAKNKDDYVGLDEFIQLIPQLPPEVPEPNTKAVEVELRTSDSRRGPLYLIKLPPEYSHNRQYPVLLALPAYGESAQVTLRRHADVCAENGYILAVPRWEAAASNYTFSEREHQVVLDVLRDVRHRFQVDSDRVFLTGDGFGGGDMAFDFGLSHPDLFAAVLPMSAGPTYFSEAYWRSAQYLPFYVIVGDRSGDPNKKVREQFTNWVSRGYASLWVQYKGRGVEWLGSELPTAFDWMRNKRRAFPLRQLGSDGLGGGLGAEYYMMRQGDNRFYWLTTDEVSPRCCNSFDSWSNRINPARMCASIDPTTNEIHVQAAGAKGVTVWLGRNAKGENMVDFDKPVTAYLNMTPRLARRMVTPSLEVLLQDLADRGDRQRLFMAKIKL